MSPRRIEDTHPASEPGVSDGHKRREALCMWQGISPLRAPGS